MTKRLLISSWQRSGPLALEGMGLPRFDSLPQPAEVHPAAPNPVPRTHTRPRRLTRSNINGNIRATSSAWMG